MCFHLPHAQFEKRKRKNYAKKQLRDLLPLCQQMPGKSHNRIFSRKGEKTIQGIGVVNMTIRRENPSDYDEVYQLVKISFATTSDSDGTEPDYLNELRNKDTFIPELSLVAENENGTLVGQIVLYKTAITTSHGELTELLLSPISVHPDYFRRGIARLMIEEALKIAIGMGFKAVFLCGDPVIYAKLGFSPSFQYNIFHKDDKSKTAKWSMVRELYNGALSGISGTVDTV